jgi:hypothetical protein
MKKYIRAMLDDLKTRTYSGRLPSQITRKPVVPEPPKPAAIAKTTRLDSPPPAPLPEDLNNQTLSDDPLQRTRQLDYQAQKSKERQLS